MPERPFITIVYGNKAEILETEEGKNPLKEGENITLYSLGVLKVTGRDRVYLKMFNPSVGIFHVEGVPPDKRTLRAALDWRNGLEGKVSENGADWYQQGDVVFLPKGKKFFKPKPIQLT